MTYRSRDKLEYVFSMEGFEMLEEATVIKVEKEKIYCKTSYNEEIIFDNNTKACLADNPTFGAKRTLK